MLQAHFLCLSLTIIFCMSILLNVSSSSWRFSLCARIVLFVPSDSCLTEKRGGSTHQLDFELHKTDHTIRFYIITTVMFNKNKKTFFVSLKEPHKWFYVFCTNEVVFHHPLLSYYFILSRTIFLPKKLFLEQIKLKDLYWHDKQKPKFIILWWKKFRFFFITWRVWFLIS